MTSKLKKVNLFDSEDKFITNINEFESTDDAIKYYCEYYRKHGYPNYSINDYCPETELTNLINFDESSIIEGKNLKQTMHSCGYLWCYFPDWIKTSTYCDKSLIDNWNDDKRFEALIKKTVNYSLKHNNGIWTTNRLRQNAKVYCSKQTVSNFRPTVAKYIYNTYGNNGKIFDPCCG